MDKPRKCVVTRSQYDDEAKKWGEPTQYKGWFHGIFQGSDGDEVGAFATIELEDGTIIEVLADRVQMLERPE